MEHARIVKLSGFWRRAFAAMLDWSFLGMVLIGIAYSLKYSIIGAIYIFSVVVGLGLYSMFVGPVSTCDSPLFIYCAIALGFGFVIVLLLSLFSFMLSATLFGWLYFTLFEASIWQGTPGKILTGLIVTDLRGEKITLARANLRFTVKLLSTAIFGAGLLLAAFTTQRQALHDVVAKTLVATTDEPQSVAREALPRDHTGC